MLPLSTLAFNRHHLLSPEREAQKMQGLNHVNRTIRSIPTLRSITYSTNSVSPIHPLPTHPSQTDDPSTINSDLKPPTVKPPIEFWPQCLYPKRLISMIKKQQSFDLSLQIFNYAGKFHPGFSHNSDTYHVMIEKLCKARAFQQMETLISQLRNSQINFEEKIFVTVIRNYGIASKPKSALLMFIRVKESGFDPSVKLFNTLLNALVQNKRFDLVHLLFKNCKRKFGINPNVITCNILIKALIKKFDLDSANRVLEEMPSMGLVPNLVTYTTILGGYCLIGDLIRARKIFNEILDHGWTLDSTTFTILINGFCKQGRLMEAIKIMDDMEENGVEPNEVTYGVMVESYCKERKSGEAHNLFDDMLGRNFIPSSSLCCRVIDVLCEDGKVEEAFSIWKKLLVKNCKPDNAISCTLLYWLLKKGKTWDAKNLFDEYEKVLVPSVLMCNTLIAGMTERGELEEARRLQIDMEEKGILPNVFLNDGNWSEEI